MYQVHTTSGFIIESRAYGEAGKILSIFTREYGLVYAVAQGIRFEKSKLRYHTQDYSFGSYSFVHGKEVWRLTSACADETRSIPRDRPGEGSARLELMVRIAFVLRRLLHGEEAHPELFAVVDECSKFLANEPQLSPEELKSLETVTVLRILDALGYIGREELVDALIRTHPLSLEVLNAVTPKRLAINQIVSRALKETHL